MNIIESGQKTILVVDDDPNTCEFLTTILTKENYQVLSTFQAKDTLGYLKQGSHVKIDLVITDLQMPGYGGFSVIKDLQGEQFVSVPILVVTGRNLDQDAINMIKMEPNVRGIHKKPIVPSGFVQEVRDILGAGTEPENQGDDPFK